MSPGERHTYHLGRNRRVTWGETPVLAGETHVSPGERRTCHLGRHVIWGQGGVLLEVLPEVWTAPGVLLGVLPEVWTSSGER